MVLFTYLDSQPQSFSEKKEINLMKTETNDDDKASSKLLSNTR